MPSLQDVVILDATRTPIGRRGGSLASVHAADLLATALVESLRRAEVDPAAVDQVVGGCVQQVGMQSGNVVRTAWLTAGLPVAVPATTVHAQCGSGQQATTLAHGLLGSGLTGVAVACGVESMSAVPFGSSLPRDPDAGPRYSPAYTERYEATTQFEAADRIATAFGISRFATEELGLSSQERAARAWREGRFDAQVVSVELPGGDRCERDECLRTTSLDALAGLKTNRAEADAVHTAGTSSQIADGAAAVLLATAARADELGARPRARIVDSVLVGSDPELMLTGPIPATAAVLERTGLSMADLDVVEVNEAFASVVLAWAKDTGADPDRTNPNGGAIALGHPLGATGPMLLTKALHELERTEGRYALVTMCCGGGLGTATIIERL